MRAEICLLITGPLALANAGVMIDDISSNILTQKVEVRSHEERSEITDGPYGLNTADNWSHKDDYEQFGDMTEVLGTTYHYLKGFQVR